MGEEFMKQTGMQNTMRAIACWAKDHKAGGVLLCLGLAAFMRCYSIDARGLEYDEAQTLAFASLPVSEMPGIIARLDVHPPLYYLQLHVWMGLFGDGDVSARSNSVFWGVLGTLILYIAVRCLFGVRGVAFAAALLFAVGPLAVRYGQQARMYALMMFLAVAVWFCLHQFFHSAGRGNCVLSGIMAFLLCSVLSFVHGTGFLIWGSATMFAVLTLVHTPSTWRRFLLWIFLQALGAALLWLWLRHAAGKGVGHAAAPSIEEINQTLGALVFGNQGGVPVATGWVLFVLLIGSAWASSRRNRAYAGIMALSFIMTPLLLCLVLSYAYKPIWLERTVSWVVPFLCVLLALLIARIAQTGAAWRPRWVKDGKVFTALAVLAVASFAALCLRQQRYLPDYGYREAVAYVHAQARPGDVVYVPGRHLWAWARYVPGKAPLDPSKTVRFNAPGGVLVVSSLKRDEYVPNRTYWVVSETARQFKDSGPFESALKADDAYRNGAKRFGRIAVARIETR